MSKYDERDEQGGEQDRKEGADVRQGDVEGWESRPESDSTPVSSGYDDMSLEEIFRSEFPTHTRDGECIPQPTHRPYRRPAPDARRVALWEECRREAAALLDERTAQVHLRAYSQQLGDPVEELRLPLAALLMATQEAFANRRPTTVEAALKGLVGDCGSDEASDDDDNLVPQTFMYRLLLPMQEAQQNGVGEPSTRMDAWLKDARFEVMAEAMGVVLRGSSGSTFNGGSTHEQSALNFQIPIVRPSGRSLGEVQAELEQWPGLAGVKGVMAEFAAQQRVRVVRRGLGLREARASWHMVFTGNPGTGKTTVARLIAEVLDATGALPGAHLVEADRSMLIGEWLGTSALKTRKVVDAALGGVLFVDEAYSLAGIGDEARQGDRFAQEALATLVKCMEDERENLVVILAGYPQEMERLLGMNAGLRSRVGLVVDFPDYADAELVDILGVVAQQSDYELASGAREALAKGIAKARSGQGFGNGRWVRSVFEASVRAHALRVTSAAGPDGELDPVEVQTLRMADVIAGVNAVNRSR